MPMNLLHRKLCASDKWADIVADDLPALLAGIDLGDDVLEIGPGFGATTRVLAAHVPRLTVIEIDDVLTRRLRTEFGERVHIVHGDGAAMPFPDGRFSAVVCFTMLHHVPSQRTQDRLFSEARRVLRPEGVFRGADSLPSLGFRLLHIGDTMNVLDPGTVPARLASAGFTTPSLEVTKDRVAFLAAAPGVRDGP